MIAPKLRDAVPQPVTLEKLLLVEGDTPAHFFEAFLKYLSIDKEIEIRNYKGISELGIYLRTISSTAEFRTKVKSLGITRDAEANPVGALNSVNAAIKAANLPKNVNVEVSILPDEHTEGMIETLFLQSVSETPVFKCVNEFFDCVEGKGISLPTGPIKAKHYVQVYLATLKEAQMMPGIAAYRGAWDFSEASFNKLGEFLTRL